MSDEGHRNVTNTFDDAEIAVRASATSAMMGSRPGERGADETSGENDCDELDFVVITHLCFLFDWVSEGDRVGERTAPRSARPRTRR